MFTTLSVIPFLAQADASPFGGGMNIMVLILMMGGFWFLLIAPQRKRQKLHEQMLKALEVGDEVLTSGGLYGTIAQVKEDRLVLKVAEGVKAEFHRTAVQSKAALPKDTK